MKSVCLVILLFLISICQAGINAPQLKWSKKGGGPYLMDGSYAGSPAVADLNGDGRQEVIWANYMLYVVDGETGNLVWNAFTGHDKTCRENNNIGRTYPGVIVADLDKNGTLEIVTGHENGYVTIYRNDGFFYNKNWPQQLAPKSEIRSLCVADLDNNREIEILAGTTRQIKSEHDWYVLRLNGEPFPGWPQDAKNPCSHGAFNQNMTVGDLDKDSFQEVIGIADIFFLNAFDHNANPLQAKPIFKKQLWADIPIWFKYSSELACDGEDGEYFPKFPFSSPVISDVDHDGQLEVVIVSYVHNPIQKPAIPIFHAPMIFNADRSRYQKNGFDWRNFPTPKNFEQSPPLSDDWRVAKVCNPNPSVADLDNDGFKEIVFPANDGKVHAYWLDQKEHGNWPFSVYDPAENVFRFPTECVIADLDGDDLSEVIFGTWPAKHSHKNGHLFILDSNGNLLHKIEVPSGQQDYNGITSAPTLANIDTDPDLEIVVGTAWTGLCAFDLPNTQHAKIQWQTGQGNFQRTGCVSGDTLKQSSEVVSIGSQPLSFRLEQNYPNPFYNTTVIPVQIKSQTRIQLEIYDILGRKIATLWQGELAEGRHNFKFDASNPELHLNSGMYYCVLKNNQTKIVSKILYLH